MARKIVLDIWCEMWRQRWMDCCCLLVRGMGKGRGMGLVIAEHVRARWCVCLCPLVHFLVAFCGVSAR